MSLFKKEEEEKEKHEHDWSVIGYACFNDPDSVYIYDNHKVESKGKKRTGVLFKCLGCGQNTQQSYGGHLTRAVIAELSKKPTKPW